jgi:hypothetical protein
LPLGTASGGLGLHGKNSAGKWWGERIEINAMPSDQLATWIQERLRAHGVQKVIPDEQALRQAYRRARKIARVEQALRRALETDAQSDGAQMPADLARKVEQYIVGNTRAWDDAIWALANEQEQDA